MSNPEAFDPYRKWLGIPPAERPPNHYRLLGLAAFEDDPEVIESAADQRMAHVRTFQAGPHSAQSQNLLNELAAARVVLLSAAKKAAYDDQLRARLAPPRAPSPAPPDIPRPVPLTPPAPRENVGAEAHASAPMSRTEIATSLPLPSPAAGSATSRRLGRRKRTNPAVWAGLAAAALAVAAFVYWAARPPTAPVAPDPAAGQDARPIAVVQNDRGGQAGSASNNQESAGVRPPKPAISESEQDSQQFDPSVESALIQRDRSTHSAAAPPAKSIERAPRQPVPSMAPETPDPPADALPSDPASVAALWEKAAPMALAPSRREAPPEGKSLAAAQAAFLQKYGKEIAAAKTPEAGRRLTIRLTNQAQEGSASADARFAMLGAAGTAAASRGDVGAAYRVANEVAREFEVDAFQLKLKALEAAAKGATTPTAFAAGALQALAMADRAARKGKFDLSSRAASQAANFARKTKDKDFTAQIDRGKAGLREQTSRNAAYVRALGELKRSPEDPAANLAAGKFETLILGDWRNGLPKLAASNDSQFAIIARLEAEARVDLGQWAPLAVAWWGAAVAEGDEFFQRHCQVQAKYAYLRAKSSGRSGAIPRELVEQIRNVDGYPLSRLRPGAAARYFEGADFQRLKAEREDAAIDFFFGEGSPEPVVPVNFFSARWTGFIKPPVTGRYRFTSYTNDSIRLWIDGEQVLNRWGQNAQWQEVELELTSEPHAIRLEYNETFEVAMAMFGWAWAAFPDPDHVQWTPVDALYYDPASPFELPELDAAR